jgi:predicted transcriptional regulator of viral defense system
MDSKLKLMRYLDKNEFVTLTEAKAMGINAMMLSRLTEQGDLMRPEPGIYTTELSWLTDPIKKYLVPCMLYPDAVICGISALTYHDLTDVEERQTWVALPPPQRVNNPRYRLIRPSGLAYSLGIEKHRFGKRVIRIYDLEKTVVDAFKYQHEEIAIKAIKRYLKRKDKNVKKLCDYARRLKKPLDQAVALIQADG